MPFDSARWQIQIAAADNTAAAFNSLQQRMRQTQIVADGMSAGMNKSLNDLAGTLTTRLVQAYGAAAIAQKVWAAGMKAADMGEQADQVGLTTDQLQAYRLEAAQNGVTVEQLDVVMMKLARTMGEANSGNDEAIAKFDKLGVKLLDANGQLRRSADVMPEVSRALLTMKSETERNALMMEIFGKSGSRMVTMLKGLAEGNDELVRKARDANAVMDAETIKTWDEVSDKLKVAQQRFETLAATLGGPLVLTGLDGLNLALKNTKKEMELIAGLVKFLFNARSPADEFLAVNKDIAAFKERGYSESDPALQDLIKRRDALQAKMELEPIKMPEIVVTGTQGTGQPTSNKTKATGESAQKKLDALIVERKALEDALSKFELQGNETVAEMEKRLDRAVSLQKKINSLTEGLPKDSPLAQQMTAEATAISDLNQKLEDKRKLMQGAEQTIAKYGDGTKAAARATEDLNKQLSEGLISPQQYALAMQDITRAQQEQAIAVRGGVEGFDAFTAGMEHIISQSSKMSRSFQYGEKAVQLMDDAIAQLVQNGEINFNRLLGSFISMIAQMEMKAAMSSLWSAFGGSMGGAGGSLIGGLVSGIGSLFGPSLSTLQGGIGPGGQVLLFADGGRPPTNRPSIVGERGPELFVPDSAGTIIPNDALGRGGGDAVAITMNNSFGGGVTHAEMLRYGAMIEERAKAGAMAGIEAKRKRGGAIKQVFRG